MNSLNICLTSHYGYLGGANRSLLALIDGARQSELCDWFSPHVIVREHGPVVTELQSRDVPTAVINFPYSVHGANSTFFEGLHERAAHMWQRWNTLPEVTERLRTWDIDLVHTNSLISDIGYRCAQNLGLPHVWHIREFGERDYGLQPDPGWHTYAQRIAESDYVITVSEALASHLRSYATIPNLQVIYNGVVSGAEVDHVSAHSEKPTSADKPLFMIVGGIMPAKGQDVAVRALMKVRESYPDARLAIVGDGDKNWISRIIEEEDARDAVQLWGYVDDPWKAYAQADTVLVCSESEGMGRVTVEAMISGTPVIGRDRAGTSELIDHGESGRLYEGEAEDLAKEMRWVLSHPTEVEQMAETAQAYASHRFTHERYADDVVQVWKSVI